MKERAKQLLYTLGLLPAALLIITVTVRLFWLCVDRYLSIFVLVLGALLAWSFVGRVALFKRSVAVTVIIFSVSLIANALFLGSLNCARCITPSGFISQGILSIQAIATREYYKNEGQQSYGGLCEDESFLDLKIRIEEYMRKDQQRCYGPLLRMLMSQSDSSRELVCRAEGNQFVVEAYLSSTKEYICGDDSQTGSVRSDRSVGDGLRCSR